MIYIKILLGTLLFIFAFDGQAQKIAHSSLVSDGDIYVSGEVILFKVFAPDEEKSGIAKVSLVSIDGRIISEVNKKTQDHEAYGYIHIPDSLDTGTYLLLAAASPILPNTSCTAKELLICNRFKGLSEINSILRTRETGTLPENQENITIEGLQKSYKTRSKAHLNLLLPAELLSRLKGNLSVSAVRHTPGFESRTILLNPLRCGNEIVQSSGVSLTGWAKDLTTGLPFKNGCICLSIPDSVPDLQYCITGDDGYFNFSLNNYHGKIPVVVQGFDMEKKRLLKISLSHRDSLNFDASSFRNQTIQDDLKREVGNNIEAATLRKIFKFQELMIDSAPPGKKQDYPFYGVPTEVVRPDQFIELPDFTQISRELLPGVRFNAYNRVPTLQILNPATLNFYNGQPLVVLDGIPVQDLNVIKNMGSKDISKIEICRKERFYGDLNFPGVLAIFSRNIDYQRITESYELLKRSVNTLQPDYSFNEPSHQPENEPDLRSVLIWKPNIKPGKIIPIDFDTSDITGSYQLNIKGITTDGTEIYKAQIFEVN